MIQGTSMSELGRAVAETRRVLAEQTAALRTAVLGELATGRPETEIAREAGVDRMTVRKWAGKR